MKKILFVFGTRPEAIKLAPVIAVFRRSREFQAVAVSTGQHRQMLDAAGSLDLKPDHDLDIMIQDQTLFDVTANALKTLQGLYWREKPDMVMVQGDTTTAFCAALGAFYLSIPVAHVEAGLRSHDLDNPFPEEANRVFIDRIASLYFAATPLAKKNLLKEDVAAKKIFVTGNTAVDALRAITKLDWFNQMWINKKLAEFMHLYGNTLRFILVTAHRRENHGKPLENICRAVRRLVERFPDIAVVYPVHLNPRVQETVKRHLAGLGDRVLLTEPLSYLDLVALMKKSYLILTDSGGIQEEAPSFGKPVLVLRKLTERPEAVMAGCAKIVGTQESRIVSEAAKLLSDPKAYRAMARVKNPFGDGKASGRILAATKGFFRAV